MVGGTNQSSDNNPLDEAIVTRAKARVAKAAAAMMIVSCLSYVISFIGVYVGFISSDDWTIRALEAIKGVWDHPDSRFVIQGFIDRLKDRDLSMERVVSGLTTAIGLVANTIVLIAGLRMKRLERLGFCVAGSIVVMMFNGCCCAGLAVGIWSLAALNDPDVKAGFAIVKRRSQFAK